MYEYSFVKYRILKHAYLWKMTFDVSLFYSISYLFINKSVHMLYIYSHYLMKLLEFFFILQAHAGIFFSSSISCMNFFFGSDTPPPRISNGPPLTGSGKKFSPTPSRRNDLLVCHHLYEGVYEKRR